MKILRIISLGYIAGGAENGVAKIQPYWTKNGNEVRIIASDLGVGKDHFSHYKFKHVDPNNPLKVLLFLFNPSSFMVLRKALKEFKPDIIHLHVMNQVTPSVLFLLKKYPTVMTLHGPETFLDKLFMWDMKSTSFKSNDIKKNNLTLVGRLEYFYFKYIQKAVYKIGLPNIDLFIAPSLYIKKMANEDVSPIVHLPNFIDLLKFYELKNNYQLLFVGRLEKVKGVDFLIKSMPAILKKYPQTKLTIIGDGPYRQNLINLVKKLKLEKNIHFKGWVENKNLVNSYKDASIVVIPSIWPENFPTVCNEAMSVGRVVIGTNVGGIPEMVEDGISGYIVTPKDSAEISEKVIHLFKKPDLLKKMGRAARKKAETYSIENYIQKIEPIYEKVIEKYKKGATN